MRSPHIARGLFNHRQLYRALRKAFPELLWKIFHPETDLVTMLNLFANARVVVGPHGAGLANLVSRLKIPLWSRYRLLVRN